MDVSTLPPVDLVARIMDDVRETFPKDEALAIALAKEGVVGDGGRPYSSRTVSAWGTGKVVPPGHVVLIAARLAGVRLDGYLYPGEAGRTDQEDKAELARQSREIQELREGMEVLMARLADVAEFVDEIKRAKGQKS